MRWFFIGATVLVAAFLSSFSSSSRASAGSFDAEAYRWAEGRTIDTVYVHGNTRVKTIAIVRELESRAGRRLEARAVDRDQRYVGDLSPFATVAIHVEPVGSDRCVLHVVVTERPSLLLKLVYPVLEYDINTERLRYGVKWKDRNFRRHLEDLSVDLVRDNRDNQEASVSWSTGWLGWKHVGLGTRASYFKRGAATSQPSIVEQARGQVTVSVPLTESRISFSQVIGGLALAGNRIGVIDEDAVDENLLSPSVGFRFDSRDGTVKPRHGTLFHVNFGSNFVLNADRGEYYRIDNDVRAFLGLNSWLVIGGRSALVIQTGSFPEYIRFGLGGPGTIRGFEHSDFRSAHRWVQSVELRALPWAKQFYRLPFLGVTDFQLGLVAFIDTGIGWTTRSEFGYENFHSGFGVGLRLYSPIQDVVRFDLGITPSGSVKPYVATGLNF